MQSLASPVSDPPTAISWSLPVSMRQDLDQEMAIPHLFRCPISLDVFTDPVTLCTGQTYDRPNIERWLQLGNLTCPVTMQRLQDSSIVPNHTLRHLIEQWTSSVIGRRPIDPDYPLMNLKQDLQSRVSNLACKLHVLREVRLLSEESPAACSRLIRLGFLSLLLELVFKKPDYTDSSQAHASVEEALSCVIELLKAADGPESSRSLSMFKEENTLASFCKLFEWGNTVVKTSLCRVIEATCSIHHDTKVDITFSRELVLLLYQNDDEAVVEASLRAIKSLCLSEPNTDALIQGGLLKALVALIRDAASGRGGNNNHLMAMAIMEITLGLEKAREALLDHPNGIKSLVSMVFRVSDLEGSESAVKCLTLVCENSLEARDAAIGYGVLSQLLLLLQSHCNCHTKSTARLLLKLLRSKEG